MALTSPRFVSSHALRNAATSSPPLAKGARGRAVHLVQMALLDLGYSMPRSTRNPIYSPDGIFGDETVAAVKQFQKDSKKKDDGIVGKDTMTELDRRFSKYGHRVRLHFRSIELTVVPFDRILRDAETVYGQYGIKIEFANGESLALTPDQATIFDRIDQDCNWDIDDGELDELHSLGSPAPATDVLVYYVKGFKKTTLLGCGGHAKSRPALTVAARAARWDTGHELGHVLLTSAFSPVHLDDVRNLMHATAESYADIPVLTDKQVAQMRTSICCRAV